MKLAGFLPVLLVIPALAQSSGPHGTRISQVQTVYLEGSSIPPAVPGSFAVPAPRRNPAPRAEFETWVEQLSRDYAESLVTGDTGVEREAGKATVHRFVRDNFRHIELTYAMTFESIPGTETFRVSFNDSAVPHPLPQILRDGETIALTLSADARTGRTMVDYIRVGAGIMSPRQGAARDVYAEDAELAISKPRLRINGAEQPSDSLPDTLSAPLVWVNIPGQGRYLLSFKPRADQGFEKAGEVAENSLVFSSAGNIFRIDSADRIATGSGTYNIYARKDSGDSVDPTNFAVGVVGQVSRPVESLSPPEVRRD